MINTFNNVDGGFGELSDDDDDSIPFNIDGGPDVEERPKKKPVVRKDDSVDIFDDPVSEDDESDPNELLNATENDDSDDGYEDELTTTNINTGNHEPMISDDPETVQSYFNNPVSDDDSYVNNDDGIQQAAASENPFEQEAPASSQPVPNQPAQQYAPQNDYQPQGQYETIPDNNSQQYVQPQPQNPQNVYYEQQQTVPQEQPQQSYQQAPSSFSIPKPDMIAKIVVIADALRDSLNDDEKSAVKTVLDIIAIQHDEISEMVYAILNARRATMQAVNDFLKTQSMEASSRAFSLIRLEDSELKTIISLGKKFGYSDDDNDITATDHISIAQRAERAVSGTPEPSVSLLQSVYDIYDKSQGILHG